MPRLGSVMSIAPAVTAVLLALAVPATASAASAGPRTVRAGAAAAPAVGGRDDYFNGDSCPTTAFCMAVGAFTPVRRAVGLSEVLSGGKWVTASVPIPSRAPNVFANEVSCASATSCLFVGQHYLRNHPASNLAEAWNGSSWQIVTMRNPPFTAFSGLQDVACPAAGFCLVVGLAGTGRRYQATAYTWKNGKNWRRLAVPRPRGARKSELGGLACFSPADCMAVGNYTSASGHFLPFADRWHDGRWKVLTTPAVPRQHLTTFQGVSCPTASQCVAVGNTEDSTRHRFFHAFAEVWSAGKWHISTLRRPPSYFIGVSCPAPGRCVAAGATFPSKTGFAHPLIESWNGLTWTTQHPVQTLAPHSGDVLQHVSCATQTDCEAVGYSFVPGRSNSDKTLAELWNGHKWTVQTTPNP